MNRLRDPKLVQLLFPKIHGLIIGAEAHEIPDFLNFRCPAHQILSIAAGEYVPLGLVVFQPLGSALGRPIDCHCNSSSQMP